MKNVDFAEYVGFQPKQQLALQTLFYPKTKYLLYGGAAGGGKSYFLRWAAVALLMYYHRAFGQRNVRVGIFCEDYTNLEDRQLSKIRFEFPPWLGKYNQQRHTFTLHQRYGSGEIAFRNLDDPSKYLSAEFAGIFIDELTRNSREIFDFLTGMRMRWIGIPEPKFVGATNPGGIGHHWVKKLWIDRDFSGENFNQEQFRFIQALYSDNKFLDPSYEEQLNSLPENLRRAYKEGDWDVFAGQVFSEFRRHIHVIKPFEIPTEWRRFTGIDYGYTNPFAVCWNALDDDGNVYLYRNTNQAGLSASEQASKILLLQGTEEIYKHFADPSMFAKTQNVQGHRSFVTQSIADIYREVGVNLAPGLNDRIQGVNIVHEFLRWSEENGTIVNQPRLHIFENCTSIIRTLPALVHDEKKVEDVDTDGDDHDYDAERYALLSFFKKAKEEPVEESSRIEKFAGYDQAVEQRETDQRKWWQ